MKKTTEIVKFNLSQKFQTVENVKMLKLFKCQAFIDIAGGLSATIIGIFIGRLIDPLIASRTFFLVKILNNFKLKSNNYLKIYDVYVIVTACHWGMRQMPKTICQNIQFKNKVYNFAEKEVANTKILTIKTALGKEIQADETIDGHFKHLQIAWNKVKPN